MYGRARSVRPVLWYASIHQQPMRDLFTTEASLDKKVLHLALVAAVAISINCLVDSGGVKDAGYLSRFHRNQHSIFIVAIVSTSRRQGTVLRGHFKQIGPAFSDPPNTHQC